ncbi:RMD9 [Candida oxycetoniae]|uniref:RMD9 n=1 Tax=Candida oxycetoniae TaxID=497107 RepID=A0AAI9STY4_9ASCO|nr:RMD9 [Candida oxycetoniae]KAI3402835.2 RMD9 [Candida oxycetoniae]
MFRIINSSQSIRPALISKFKHTGGAGAAAASSPIVASTSTNTTTTSNFDSKLVFLRTNSTVAEVAPPPPTTANANQDFPLPNGYAKKFTKCYHKPNHFTKWSSTIRRFDTIEEFSKKIQDEEFRRQMSSRDLAKYVASLYSETILSRRERLGSSRNRDKDNAASFHEDIIFQSAIINLSELIAAGEWKQFLNPDMLFKIFGTLLQFKLNNEILDLWETGVSWSEEENGNGGVGRMFLTHKVLSMVLQVAYDSKRFTYDEIKSIYKMSVNEADSVHPDLIERMGQIAIREGDHARGLDALEALMAQYEAAPSNRYPIESGLSQLHLVFIGKCKDTLIAKRFFEKAVEEYEDLPYSVILKAPYMVSFLENCVEAGDPMEEVIDIWSRICRHYAISSVETAARASTVNTGLFKLFFKKYPEPTDESLHLLKLIFSKSEKIDELFLNTLTSNMVWTDKSLIQDVINAFDKFNVPKSVISHRIILKKTGSADYSIEEILALWNQLLQKLDDEGYQYIANADWSALMNATVLSEQSSTKERLGLYLSILKTYKNYMQHDNACTKFLRAWIRDADMYKIISRITTEENPQFENEVVIETPKFKNLRESTNYRRATKVVTDANPRLLD